jgi:hypothetical protein
MGALLDHYQQKQKNSTEKFGEELINSKGLARSWKEERQG